ncbi:MAG: esterase [Rubrivivax sp.]|jgi:outer membrane lipase/esterase|nr:esterase [Rubrivivax sp.]
MIFSSKATVRWQRAVAGLVGAMALAAVVVACGGGTSQYETFVAKRVIVFGDDASALTPTGRNYSVNGLDATTGVVDCNAKPIWVQSVAQSYGFVFAECNPTNSIDPQARTFAVPGALVDDVASQVEAQVAAGGFREGDLALVMGGMNDVLHLYSLYPLRPEESLIADAQARGRRMAGVVNRLVDLGAKVVVSNLPDMGMTPYARAETAANIDIDRAAIISRLAAAFNDALGTTMLLDGRFVGLVQADLRTLAAQRSPASFGLVDVASAVCTVALPNCTTGTLVTGADSTQYLWADNTRLGPGGHALLANMAIERARSNPF